MPRWKLTIEGEGPVKPADGPNTFDTIDSMAGQFLKRTGAAHHIESASLEVDGEQSPRLIPLPPLDAGKPG